MKILESSEMYLETILVLKEKNGKVKSIDVANDLGYSKASVSVAMKQLRENGYVRFEDDNSITLLPIGEDIAKKVYEKHKLLTNALIKLGVDPITASNDACKIEHVISEESLLAFSRFLSK